MLKDLLLGLLSFIFLAYPAIGVAQAGVDQVDVEQSFPATLELDFVEEEILSSIPIQFDYSLAELERSLNELLQGRIFEDNRFGSTNQDTAVIQVFKNYDLTVEKLPGDNATLRVRLPLKVKVIYKIDEAFEISFLRWTRTVRVQEHQPISFDIMVTLDVTPEITPTLELRAQTEASFIWITYPYVNLYYFFRFRIADQVEGRVQDGLDKLSREKINTTIEERVNLKQLIAKQQDKLFNTPIAIDPENGIWGVFSPTKFFLDQLAFNETEMIIRMQAKGHFDLLWDDDAYQQLNETYPAEQKKQVLPQLTRVEAGDFLIHAPVRVSTKEIQTLVVKHLAHNPIVINEGKNAVNVREIYIRSQENSFSADVYMSMINRNRGFDMVATVKARPIYASYTGTIELRDVDYSLSSDSGAISLWNTLNKERLRLLIIENVRLPVEDLTQTIETLTQEGVNDVSISGIGSMSIGVDKVEIKDLFMENDYFVVEVNLYGSIRIRLENLF